MSSELKFSINSRKYIRKLVTECHNKRHTFSTHSTVQKDQLKAQLTDHLELLKKHNSEIQNLKWGLEEKEDWLDDELAVCESYYDKIRECLSFLKENATPCRANLDAARSLLKSPTAPLPEFKSKEGEDLIKFFKDFEDITSLFNYSEYDRFILLKQQISGRALTLLNALESDKQGYAHAKTLLTDALASKDNRIFSAIKQLSEMKMLPESDPFEYVSLMKNLTQTVVNLSLGYEDFLRYFFWHGMNESFKQHMTQITNSSKPTLKQINDSFFEASERYQESLKSCKFKKFHKVHTEKTTPTKSASGYAAKVTFEKEKLKFHPCVLCSTVDCDASHPIYKCERFPDARSKVDKLILLKGCTKCSNLRHTNENCTFRFFNRCKFCKAWHFHFLCVKNLEADKSAKEEESKSSRNKNKKKESSVHVTVSEVFKSMDAEACILPTFSCKINGKYVRALKDGGCQSNFITEGLFRLLNLKVLQENVKLKINGINASQDYISKLVQFEMNIGDEIISLQAFCIPSFNMNLKLPDLSRVVQSFEKKVMFWQMTF